MGKIPEQRCNKEDIQVQISAWKDAAYQMASGKFKLKQWDAITHILECLKSEHWRHQTLASGATVTAIHFWWECKM